MPKYTVPVERRILDVYLVDAKSPTDAGVKAGMMMGQGVPPDSSTELSMRIMSAKQQLPDNPFEEAIARRPAPPAKKPDTGIDLDES